MSPSPWTIRRATPGDAGALALLGAATFLETYAGEVAGADIVAHCRTRHAEAVYVAWLASADHAIWLVQAASGEAAVGYAVLSPGDIPLAREGDLELQRIYVLSRWHGGGAGRALASLVAQEARARGARRLLVAAYARNAGAIAFYARCGFTPVGSRSFTVGSMVYDDDVVLALTLAPQESPP